MILVDVNLLVYAWDRRSPHNDAAIAWLDGKLSGSGRVGLPWECLLGFMRVVTNSRIYERPASVNAAWEQVQGWLGAANVWVPTPGERHGEILGRLFARLGGGAKLIPDAHLAAIAIEHGLALCSTDGDFARFEGLRWVNPLIPNGDEKRPGRSLP
jgi:toxin-antitoxin system PIN domain toxin